jgi:hypothetical protein
VSDEAEVRRVAMALPEVQERTVFGTPGFYVGKKLFARVHEQPGVLVVWRADLGEREALLQAHPDVYFTTPHYDGHASVLVRLERIASADLAELLQEAWECRAPKRLLPRGP